MNGDVARRLSVVDPSVDGWIRNDVSAPRYFARLRRAASGEGYEFGCPAKWSPLQTDYIAHGAAQGLTALHS